MSWRKHPEWWWDAALLIGVRLLFARWLPPVPEWQLLVMAAGMATQLLPTLAVLALPRPVPVPRQWIAVWGAAFFLSDFFQLAIARATGENLWFFLVANPIEDAAFLMAFSHWQTRPVMRLSFRLAIPLVAAITLAIALYFGEANSFKAVSSPFRLLVLSAAAGYTLVSRAAQETDRIWRRDWLWTGLGTMLYYAAYVVVDPVSRALIASDHMEYARLVYVVKAAVDTLAFLMVWKGMRCPLETTSSLSTSAPSSPSLLSS